MLIQHWTKPIYCLVCEMILSALPFDTVRMHSDVQLSAYKSSAADSLLAERGRIDNSHRMTDDILA